ncbi:helix-turn-helix domain-containing protein [Pectinatus frisingensis]|uniref:helix-turn-helix domain-containing protein n=1 Tax=Pectinatus frisingensis TaxID=865 RepID=UPI0018C8118B|nr:helix-turn-helix domain-containing protein [Pectinatus frisingensis]
MNEPQYEITGSVPIWKKYLLSPDEASELTGLSTAFIRYAGQMTKAGEYDLPCVWIGNHLKINRLLLEKWLEDKTDGHRDFKTAFIIKQIKEAIPHRGRPRKVR